MRALALLLLVPALALAQGVPITKASLGSDYVYVGTLNASSGATTNNNAAACTLPTNYSDAGVQTGAIGSLGGTKAKPVRIAIQCDVPSRFNTGAANTVVATNSGANKGVKLDTEQLFFLELTVGWLAIIPASGSGSAACDVFKRLP